MAKKTEVKVDLGDMDALMSVLSDDIGALERVRRAHPDDQALLRASFRTLMASIEGFAFAARQVCLDRDHGVLTEAERMALAEQEYYLDKGRVEVRGVRASALNLLLLTINMLHKVGGSTYQLDLGRGGWDQVKTAFDLRNRIAHPKRPGDLCVTDSQLEGVRAALKWMAIEMTRALYCAFESVADRSEEAKAAVAKLRARLEEYEASAD
jgi:hypothetical protein